MVVGVVPGPTVTRVSGPSTTHRAGGRLPELTRATTSPGSGQARRVTARLATSYDHAAWNTATPASSVRTVLACPFASAKPDASLTVSFTRTFSPMHVAR